MQYIIYIFLHNLILRIRPKQINSKIHAKLLYKAFLLINKLKHNLFLYRIPIPDNNLFKFDCTIPKISEINNSHIGTFLLHTVKHTLESMIIDDNLNRY